MVVKRGFKTPPL